MKEPTPTKQPFPELPAELIVDGWRWVKHPPHRRLSYELMRPHHVGMYALGLQKNTSPQATGDAAIAIALRIVRAEADHAVEHLPPLPGELVNGGWYWMNHRVHRNPSRLQFRRFQLRSYSQQTGRYLESHHAIAAALRIEGRLQAAAADQETLRGSDSTNHPGDRED